MNTASPKIIAEANLKGGVGKSTTTVNCAHYAHEFLGKKTCIVDLDAQANSSRTIAPDWPKGTLVASDLFQASLPLDRLPMTSASGIDLVPGDKLLKAVDAAVSSDNIAARRALYQTFRTNIRKLMEQRGYDLIIIDTPTTAEQRYYAALVAADYSVTPALMDAYSLQGAGDLKQSLANTKAQFGNPRHKHLGILPNLFTASSSLHKNSLEKLRQAGIKIIPVTLVNRIAVQGAIDAGNPVWKGDRDGRKNAKASAEWKAACKAIFDEVFA